MKNDNMDRRPNIPQEMPENTVDNFLLVWSLIVFAFFLLDRDFVSEQMDSDIRCFMLVLSAPPMACYAIIRKTIRSQKEKTLPRKDAQPQRTRLPRRRIISWENECSTFGEYKEDKEKCVACAESTSSRTRWCRKFSKEPSKEEMEKWRDPDSDIGCETFGEEFDQEDEDCNECFKDKARMWFWCRKQSSEKE